MKKICVVGLGSIGKRHIRNIKRIYSDVRIDILRHGKTDGLKSDSVRRVPSDTDQEYGRELTSYDELDVRYDAVFITNPTTMHMDTLSRLTDRSDAFFIEKPLRALRHGDMPDTDATGTGADGYKAILDRLPAGKIYYVACPMRYTNIIRYIRNNIDMSGALCLRAISSSYLPQWRPGTDYTKCYSARREMGGGVAADLIHEWDYLSYLIGRPERVYAIERKLSGLDIDVEDIAVYIGEYRDKLAEVHLDYFGRATQRSLQILTAEDTIDCDFIGNRIRFLRSGDEIRLEEDRDDYQIAELKHFFDIAEGRTDNDSTIYDAESLLELLDCPINLSLDPCTAMHGFA